MPDREATEGFRARLARVIAPPAPADAALSQSRDQRFATRARALFYARQTIASRRALLRCAASGGFQIQIGANRL